MPENINNPAATAPFAPVSGSPTPTYQVWFIPTKEGEEAFKWKAHLYGNATLMTKDEAEFEAYLANLDDPAPDARRYGGYEVREVSENDITERTA